jgi:uncharacterized protein (DUF433 family)
LRLAFAKRAVRTRYQGFRRHIGLGAQREEPVLDQGFYTMREAVGLIGLDVPGINSTRLRPLFDHTDKYPPAVESSRAYDGRVRDISFHDLIELRFVAHFRQQGISQQAIRAIARIARDLFGERPFARGDIRWRTDGKKIYSSAASETGDHRLLELLQKQYELAVIEESLRTGIDWDAKKFARSWIPRPKALPLIIVDPRSSFGMPSIVGRGIAAETIFDAVKAERGNQRRVAGWYGLTLTEVRQAVRFHDGLAM